MSKDKTIRCKCGYTLQGNCGLCNPPSEDEDVELAQPTPPIHWSSSRPYLGHVYDSGPITEQEYQELYGKRQWAARKRAQDMG